MHRTSFHQPYIAGAMMISAILTCGVRLNAEEDRRIVYARELLTKAGLSQKCDLRVDGSLGQAEAFSITDAGSGRTTVAGGGPAGVLYGAQEFAARKGAVQKTSEKPDFPLRGTALFLMKEGSYDYELTPKEFPWFYDRELLTRYLDYLFESRFNAIFLWSGNMFPSLVELPEYPDARTLSQEQLLANQEQFRWFTDECAKRNISVLMHFYNIHLTKALAESRKIPMHYSAPDPFAAKFVHYTLVRFLTEFASVGLYVCPGEALDSKYQPEWIRDVILKAAVDSGKHPWVVVRDWGLPGQSFKEKCHYDNLFTELKHNIEMVVSPVPDTRHAFWVGGEHKHIVNVHEAADLKPFRWASPLFIHEMVENWKKTGLDGAEVYGRVSWRWPNALDKLAPDQWPYWPAGPRLLTFDRDALWLQAFGRYLWKVERDPKGEAAHWTRQLAARFGSPEAGKALYNWYNLTGPILPGLQNLTSVLNMNFYPTAVGKEQMVDDILSARKSIEADIKNNESRPKVLVADSNYPGRPVDTFFFERYKAEYGPANLTNRLSMPVAEYAEKVAKGQKVTDAMTPVNVADLLVKMARESEALAQEAAKRATENKDDAARYVTDSQAMRLIAEYYRAKVKAAFEKRLWQLTEDESHLDALSKQMDESMAIYRQLVELTDRTYIAATDMITRLSWHKGQKAADRDLVIQKDYVSRIKDQKRLGLYWIEAEEMDGTWTHGRNYKGYSGTSFRVANSAAERATELTKSLRIYEAGKYAVWARALIGGYAPDRTLVVRVNDTAFPASHGEQGPECGAFVWHKVGEVQLTAGTAKLAIKAVGKGYVCPDVIVLAKDPRWKPEDR